MTEISFAVGVVAERRAIDHPWQDHVWEPVAVLAGVPQAAAWTQLSGDARAQQYYIGATDIVLAASETTGYRDNLMSPPPRLWVVVREEGGDHPLTLVTVTADPMEAEGHTESGTSIVAAVPMPPEIAGEIAAFVDAHHVERAFVKRKRKRHIDGEMEA